MNKLLLGIMGSSFLLIMSCSGDSSGVTSELDANDKVTIQLENLDYEEEDEEDEDTAYSIFMGCEFIFQIQNPPGGSYPSNSNEGVSPDSYGKIKIPSSTIGNKVATTATNCNNKQCYTSDWTEIKPSGTVIGMSNNPCGELDN